MTTLPAPTVKVCPDCGAPFTQGDQPDNSWKRTRYCPPCGDRRSRGGRGAPRNITAPAVVSFEQMTSAPRDWRTSATCRGQDPELFFSFTSNWRAQPIVEQVSQAKAVCARCPVTAACLEAALVEGDQFAVRGGTTPDERRALKRGAA